MEYYGMPEQTLHRIITVYSDAGYPMPKPVCILPQSSFWRPRAIKRWLADPAKEIGRLLQVKLRQSESAKYHISNRTLVQALKDLERKE